MASSHSTPVVRPPARTVVLVGSGGGGDIAALATGWPLTSAQQEVIHEAMRAAADLRLEFEAHLLATEAEVEDHLLAGDNLVGLVTEAPMVWPAEAADERPVASFA